MCKISVIVPVYNGENDIEKCISKLLEQTFQDVEIIVVNDGSTDRTEQICKQIMTQDTRVKLYTQENAGPSAARNKGIELATGEWVVFVDSDDWLESNCLEYVYNVALEENVDIVLWNLQNEQKDMSVPYVPFKGERRIFLEDEIYQIKNILFTDKTETKASPLSIKGPYCKLIKRAVIEDSRFPLELNLGEDVCFAHQLFDNVQKVMYVNKIFYHRILNGDSLSQKKDIKRGEKRSKYVNWVLNYRSDYDAKILNEFAFLKYRELVLYYLGSKLDLTYKGREEAIERFLRDINWEIDFSKLTGHRYLFLLEHKLYFVIYIFCFMKNMLLPTYRCLKRLIFSSRKMMKKRI